MSKRSEIAMALLNVAAVLAAALFAFSSLGTDAWRGLAIAVAIVWGVGFGVIAIARLLSRPTH